MANIPELSSHRNHLQEADILLPGYPQLWGQLLGSGPNPGAPKHLHRTQHVNSYKRPRTSRRWPHPLTQPYHVCGNLIRSIPIKVKLEGHHLMVMRFQLTFHHLVPRVTHLQEVMIRLQRTSHPCAPNHSHSHSE